MNLQTMNSPREITQMNDFEICSRYLYDRYRIDHIGLCVCGALTFEVEHGIGYSVKQENAPKFFRSFRKGSGRNFTVLSASTAIAITASTIGVLTFAPAEAANLLNNAKTDIWNAAVPAKE